MKTKAYKMNDALLSTDENIGRKEVIIRLTLSAFLLSVIFVNPAIAHKILYVVPALYLYTTAILQWDFFTHY